MHNFVVHSNESLCRKINFLGWTKSMIHARVLDDYIHFALMYTEDHIFPVLPIKDLINEDGETTTPYKPSTGMKHSILHSRVISCLRVVKKSTAHVGKKVLNMCHQVQKGFCGIFVGIPQHQKGILFMYHTNKISYFCTMLILIRVSIVRLCTFHNHM